MRKTILEKRLKRLMAKKQTLDARCTASTDAAEVRSLTEELVDINAEIDETREELAEIEAEEKLAQENRAQVPASAELRNPVSVTSFEGAKAPEKRDAEDYTSTMEYRRAFMRFVQSEGREIPKELRAGDAISTNDTKVAIPFTIVNRVINTVRKRYGNLYSKVRKISVRGGVEYPIGALRASFKWINESVVSPRQKMDALGKIMFGYHTAEIRIAQTFLSQLLTIEAFEAEITDVIVMAYLEAMDYGIVNGSGNGTMLGILNDPRVTNTITMTAAQINNWAAWRKNFFAKLPLGYRSGEFIFPVSTVDAYLETMADANNNPIFRQATGLEVNDGDAINPNGRFFGRNISLVEPDIIADFDEASSGDVIGLFWQPEEYAINENFGFMMRKYFDDDANEWVDKALVVVDGKVLNPNGFYKIIKA